MRQAQAEDWLDDLTEFDAEIVAAACREWRQSNNRRPTPHDVRGLCIREASRRRERPQYEALPPPSPAPKRERTLNCWEPGYAKRYNEPWFKELPIETQRRYKEQDLARSDAWMRMQRAVSVEERIAAEAAYAKICMDQVSSNLSRSVIVRANSGDPIGDAQRLLGITATPRWHSDDAVRTDGAALGLEARNG